MKICNHALHRGNVYAKPSDAIMACIKMIDTASYLNKLLTNEAIRGKVLKHFSSLLRILSHSAYVQSNISIVPQIEFNLELIEVSHSFFFHIPTHAFIPKCHTSRKNAVKNLRELSKHHLSLATSEKVFSTLSQILCSVQTSVTSSTNVSWHSKCPIKYGNSWLVPKIQGRCHGHQFPTGS